MNLHAPLAAITIVLAAQPVLAQTTVGTLSGTIEGEQIDYAVLDGEAQATGWDEVEDGIEVRLEAYPADTPASEDTRLMITFVADAATRSPELLRGDVELARDGEMLTATTDAMNFVLESFEASGSSLLVTGNMEITVSAGEEDVSVASEEGVTLSLDSQITLIREEE